MNELVRGSNFTSNYIIPRFSYFLFCFLDKVRIVIDRNIKEKRACAHVSTAPLYNITRNEATHLPMHYLPARTTY